MSSSPPRTSRDLRIDAFRGLALLVILIDHTEFSVIAPYTYGKFGYSDAAQLFVFLSGYVYGIVYGRALAEHGFWHCLLRSLKRAFELYLALLATFALHLVVIHVAEGHALGAVEPPWLYKNLHVFFEDPGAMWWHLARLAFSPPILNILALYAVFLAAFPILLWIERRWGRWAMLGVSFALYLVPLVEPAVNMPAWPRGGWYFSPLSWQLLFAVAIVLSHSPDVRAKALASRGLAIAAAVLVLVLALVYLAWPVPGLRTTWVVDLLRNLPGDMPHLAGKERLGLLSLAHFLALALLAARLLPKEHPLWATRVAGWFAVAGRNSLLVFCAGSVLSFAGSALFALHPESFLVQAAFYLAAAASLVLLARAAQAAQPRRTP